jgi:hypothetical protein
MIQASNDSTHDVKSQWVAGVNVLMALISAVFGAIALLAPGANPGITGELTSATTYYAAMYGVRALPLAAAVTWLAWTGRATGWPRLVPVLILAGVIQLGDAIIGMTTGTPAPIIGATIAAAVHLTSAWYFSRVARRLSPTSASAPVQKPA